MLYLLFQIGTDRYALDTRRVVEVLPLVQLKSLPQAPPEVAGVFDYHGAPVPLIDLCQLALGRSSLRRMSTRIILVTYPNEAAEPSGTSEPTGASHLLGLLAEQATTTLSRSESEFGDAGVAVDEAPYLGPVTTDAGGMIQRVEIEHLLSAEVRDLLFRESLEPV